MEIHYVLELKSILRKVMVVTEAEKKTLIKDNFMILIYWIIPFRSGVESWMMKHKHCQY